MGKTILIVTCLIDEIDEKMGEHLHDVLHDGCPVELIINGRHIPVTFTSHMLDTRI